MAIQLEAIQKKKCWKTNTFSSRTLLSFIYLLSYYLPRHKGEKNDQTYDP